MNYAGSDLKFKISTSIEGFTLAENEFSVTVKNRLGKAIYTIEKDDCFTDDEGNYYFVIEKVPNGYLFAYFYGEAEDADFDSDVRRYTDEQVLCSVGVCDCSSSSTSSSCTCTHSVEYTQIYTSNASGVQYLCDEDGNYILDSDGNKIELSSSDSSSSSSAKVKLDMTGDEIKELLEGNNSDGTINTIPEIIEALNGLSENSSYGVSSEDNIADMMDEILNN